MSLRICDDVESGKFRGRLFCDASSSSRAAAVSKTSQSQQQCPNANVEKMMAVSQSQKAMNEKDEDYANSKRRWLVWVWKLLEGGDAVMATGCGRVAGEREGRAIIP